MGLMVSWLAVSEASGQGPTRYPAEQYSAGQVTRLRPSSGFSNAQRFERPQNQPPLNFGGWIAARPTEMATTQLRERSSNFQQFSDLPDINSLNFPQNDFAAPGPAASQRELGNGGMPNMLGNNPQRQSAVDPRMGNIDPRQLRNLQYDARDRFGNVVPPPSTSNSAQLAAFQNGGTGLVPEATGNLGNQLQPIQQIASGLPYVTPAPNQRYPTSPYLGGRLYPANYLAATSASYIAQQPAVPGSVLPQPLPGNPQPIYSTPGAYPAATGNCAPSLPPGGNYVPPTVPPDWNPSMYSPNNSGYRPLISLGQENYNVVLGRGILGQPTAYVPGQYVRNFLRYIFP
jgi:hypothetical protein